MTAPFSLPTAPSPDAWNALRCNFVPPPLLRNSTARQQDGAEGTSFDILRRDIIVPGGVRAANSYREWLAKINLDSAYGDIQNLVGRLNHTFIHDVSLDEINRITRHPDPRIRTGHALGPRDPDKKKIIETADFQTPWTFSYIMHEFVERIGRIPRWEEFDAHLRGTAFDLYYRHYRIANKYDQTSPKLTEEEIRQLERAFQWRAGLYYYSFLREIDVMTRLRLVHGLPVRYHILADVNFRVDFWCGDVIALLYVRNPLYRNDGDGRKSKPGDHLDIRNFKTVTLGMRKPDAQSYGYAELYTPDAIAALAREIEYKMGAAR